MKKPKTIKRGRTPVYNWDSLQKKGDFFELPDADDKKARSCRTCGRVAGLKVSVIRMQKGGYLVELTEDREK